MYIFVKIFVSSDCVCLLMTVFQDLYQKKQVMIVMTEELVIHQHLINLRKYTYIKTDSIIVFVFILLMYFNTSFLYIDLKLTRNNY